ncbi:alpha-2-macroglobulin-like protein [Plakobranchus ocellatus]|uniref:Alpha-2-macroglobulin-like protein n=1 Tax=Plakobranchus ocellatus TaxID=259542 RepID=A0AAV4C8A7_9GAST|nr:alpha-2-macroglobulin-like protein [Plakobranchus ocellatus]
MAPRNLVCFSIQALILALGLSGAYARDGFVMTIPLTLRSDTWSEYCMILYGDVPGQRDVTLSLSRIDSGERSITMMDVFTIGRLHCERFPVPPPGDYNFTLSNSTNILHDPITIAVTDNRFILIQLEQPVLKRVTGFKVMILTLMTSMKPRTHMIRSVKVTNRRGIVMDEVVNVTTTGIAHVGLRTSKFSLAMLYTLEVILDSGVKVTKIFYVPEYNYRMFEISIETPTYVPLSYRTISGRVCGSSTESDNVPVFGSERVNLRKLKKSKRTLKLSFNILKTDVDLRNKFTISVENKFEGLNSLTTAE